MGRELGGGLRMGNMCTPVVAHALQALRRKLLQAPLQEAVLPLQLLLDAQRPPVLLLQFLGWGDAEL